MVLPKLHVFKPGEIAFTMHSDLVENGFITYTLAARLGLSHFRKGSNPLEYTVLDTTPWFNNEPLTAGVFIPAREFVLILQGPYLLNGTEWFYQILWKETRCWMPALKLMNIYPGLLETEEKRRNEKEPSSREPD